MQYVYLPATNKRVTLGQYVKAFQLAKANPDTEFAHGLNTWWPVTGKQICNEFRQAIHYRINERANEQWRNVLTQKEIEEQRDCRRLHDWLQKRIICRRLTTKKLQKRFAYLLYQDDDM